MLVNIEIKGQESGDVEAAIAVPDLDGEHEEGGCDNDPGLGITTVGTCNSEQIFDVFLRCYHPARREEEKEEKAQEEGWSQAGRSSSCRLDQVLP